MRYLAILLFTFIAYFGSAQVRLNQLERCPDGADCCITTDSRGVQYYIYPCSELWDSLLLFYVNDSLEVRLGDTLTFRDSGAVRVFIDTAKKTVTYYVDSAGIDTDHQTLTWDNNTRTLSIIRGNSVVIPDSVNIDTDDQYPDVFYISGDTLYISLENSDTLKRVYLGGYLDDTDTDNYVDAVSFADSTITIGRTGVLPDLTTTIKDHDWYLKNTSAIPNSINDTIWTNGAIGINRKAVGNYTIDALGVFRLLDNNNNLFVNTAINANVSGASYNYIFGPNIPGLLISTANTIIGYQNLNGANTNNINYNFIAGYQNLYNSSGVGATFSTGYRNYYSGITLGAYNFSSGQENFYSLVSAGAQSNNLTNGYRNYYSATAGNGNNFGNGQSNFSNATSPSYNFGNGRDNFSTGSGTMQYNFGSGYRNGQSMAGQTAITAIGFDNARYFTGGGYSLLSGGLNANGINGSSGSILYSLLIGYQNYHTGTSITQSYGIGVQNALSAGSVQFAFIAGGENFNTSTSLNHVLGHGYRIAYNATDLSANNTIAIGDQALLNASSLDNVTALGWQAGKSNAFANVTLLGDTAVATADRQFAVSNYYQTAKLKNYLFNIDQDTTGKNGYVLTYNHASNEIELSNAPTLVPGSDNYVDAASYAGYTLTLGRTGVLADFNIPIDIQYLDTFQVTNDTLFASIANDGRAASKVNLSGFRDHDFYNVWNANIYPFHIDTAVYRTGKTVMGSTNDVAGILNVVGNIGVNGGSYNTVKDGSFRGATSTGNNNVGLGYRNSYLNQSGSWIAAFGQQNFENVAFSNYLFASGQDNFKTAAGNYNFGFGLQNGQTSAGNYNFLAGYRNAQNAGSYITAFGYENFKLYASLYSFASGYNNVTADTAISHVVVFGDSNFNGTSAATTISTPGGTLNVNGYSYSFALGSSNYSAWKNSVNSFALGTDNFQTGIAAYNAFAFGKNNYQTNNTGSYFNVFALGEYNLNNLNGDGYNVFAHGYSNALRGTDLVNVFVQGDQNLNQAAVFGGSVENVLIQGKDNMRNIKTAFGSMAQGTTNFYDTKESIYGYALGVNNFYSADTVNTSFGMGSNNFQAAANVRNSVSIGSGFTSITGNADFLINVGYGFEAQTSATKAILVGSTSRDTISTSTANNTIIFGHDAFVGASEIDSTIVVGNSAGNSNAWKSNILLGHGAEADTSYQFRVGANYRQAALNRYRLNIDQDTTGKNDWVLTKVASGEIELKELPAGSGATDLTFTGASSPYTLNSSTGTDVTFAQGGIVTLSRSTNQLTISATEVDGSVSNEGTLGVGAGSSITSTIISNTSGANPVTIEVGGILTIGESTSSNGGLIVISATEVDGSTTNEIDNLTFSGASSPVTLNSSGGTDVTFTAGNNISFSGITGTNLTINAGGSDLSFTGTGSPATLNSSGGADVTFTAGNGISFTTTSTDVTIQASDISQTNELQSLTFTGASSPYTLDISNSTGDVTFAQGGIVTISRSVNQLTISATEVDGSTTNEIDNLTFSGASSPVTLNSSGGTDVTVTAGSGISLSATSGNMTITASDISATNEGTLGVGAGGANTAVITSNTSGASGVTINGSTGISITETTSSNGGQINIFADNASVWYESGATPANDNTSAIYHGGKVAINQTSVPSYALEITENTGWIYLTSGSYDDLKLSTGTNGAWIDNGSEGIIMKSSTGEVSLFAGNVQRLLANATGVGIKRTPATNDLEVAGAASKATAGDWLANSDRRIKDLIHPVQDPYDIMERLEPVTFRYTDEYLKLNPSIKDRVYYNYIAQDYAKVFPDDVKGSGEYLPGDKEEILQMDGHAASIATTAAVKQLIQDLKALKRRVDEQEKEIKALRSKRK